MWKWVLQGAKSGWIFSTRKIASDHLMPFLMASDMASSYQSSLWCLQIVSPKIWPSDLVIDFPRPLLVWPPPLEMASHSASPHVATLRPIFEVALAKPNCPSYWPRWASWHFSLDLWLRYRFDPVPGAPCCSHPIRAVPLVCIACLYTHWDLQTCLEIIVLFFYGIWYSFWDTIRGVV